MTLLVQMKSELYCLWQQAMNTDSTEDRRALLRNYWTNYRSYKRHEKFLRIMEGGKATPKSQSMEEQRHSETL